MTSKRAANNGSKRQQEMLEKLAIALIKGISVNPRCVVYDDFSGTPLSITFLGKQWWLTTPGEKLQPVKDYFDGEDIDLCFLCEDGGKVGALALAKMLGKAAENPEDKVDEVLRQRVKSLKRLDVNIDVKDEPLLLELVIISNERYKHRQGKYSALCHLHGNLFERIFDIDAFDTKHDAEEWVSYYFDALEKEGVEFRII